MELSKLKEHIQNGFLPTQLVVLVCPENFFIADQYINTFCAKSGKEKRIINSIFEQDSAMALVVDYSETVNVLKTDVFSELAEDYSAFENIVIIWNKVDKKLESVLADYIIQVPALKDWQVKDYIKQICPELDQLEIDWLYKATGGNIYRVEAELDKVLLFHPKFRKQVLAHLRYSKDSDLHTLSVFDLCDAIIYNKKNVIVDYLRHRSAANFELMSLTSNLVSKIKNLLMVKYAGKSFAELEISKGQHYHLVNAPMISVDRLQNLLNIATNIDYQLKSGLLDISKESQLDYVISKMCY